MNVYLRNAPTWVLSVYFGLIFAICLAIEWPILQHGRATLPDALLPAVVGGILFGAIIGPKMARQRREVNALVGPLSDDAYRSAKRAAIRGPVPSDPETRSAAERLAENGLTRLNTIGARVYVALAIIELMVAASFAYHALTSSAWYWAQAILFVFLAVIMLYPLWLRGHLTHRIELLR
ncbi:hypothetical protein [Antrihabitans stalactiti]|uniref:Uncharacterized protein n=1 Tax=Antrihabitans stalactiti TaxID=2584121 RepID=A0A848KBY0_9NOCA|nr:hypothetical protein [Antrihabitans stalactiti]NMN96393.1 hypothetical protein [Antrihabitans stalactiti]